MKFNYKKIATVVGSALMIGSSVGIAAAAAYPAPFVVGGAADAAIVYGSSAASQDVVAAGNIGSQLQTKITTGVTGQTGTTATASGGDSIKIEKPSDKLNLNEGLTNVWGTSITKSDLKTLLADSSFFNKQNTEYKYTQKFDLGNLTFGQWQDSDYDSVKVPQLGIKVTSNQYVANYTLDFTTDPEATNSADLTDFENKNIVIMGKNYYILDFKNSTAKLTLLDAATSTSLIEGESKTLTVGDKPYDVSISFISTDEIILTVNGENTEKLSATGTTYGNTFKLSDGTYVGVKTINVQNYAGGSKSVDFSIGKGKLEITDGSNVKINDKSITDVYGYIIKGISSGKITWQKLGIKWQVDDEAFLTPTRDLTMPGFEAIKFTMGQPSIAKKELTSVDFGGSDYIELKTTIKSGAVSIPILYMASTTSRAITGTGKATDQRLVSDNDSVIQYNATGGLNEGFVASWASTKDAESYYLKATVSKNSDNGVNKTTFKDKVTGEDVCTDVEPGNTCTIGNVVLTVNYAEYATRITNFSINSGGSFNKLYTAEGLRIILPWSTSQGTSVNSTLTGSFNSTGIYPGQNGTGYTLWLSEKDKDGTLAQKDFNVTISLSGSSPYKITASAVGGSGTALETLSSSKLWESYVPSTLATKITHDQTNSDQYSVDVEYHGTELYGNVFVSAPSVTINSGTTEVGVASIADTEIASASGKNLIVVGGSCINTVAAKILESDSPICGADFTSQTGVGAGEYLIKTVASPYSATKVAMLVAGYDAADTTKGVTDLNNNNANFEATAGMTYKGSSTAIATVVTTTA